MTDQLSEENRALIEQTSLLGRDGMRVMFTHELNRLLNAARAEGPTPPADGEVTFWKRLADEHAARAEKAEAERDALAERVKEAVAALNAAETTMTGKGWWRNFAGYLTDAALWVDQARAALTTKGEG